MIGLDAHPSLFSAAALSGADALQARTEWVVDRQPLDRLEAVLRRRVREGDEVVLEASGNSFSVAERLAKIGLAVRVLDSSAVSRVGSSYCVTDKVDAVKLARVALSGLANVVWVPDAESRERRELFFTHRNAVRDAVRERNRFWGWCNGHGIRIPKGFRLTKPEALKIANGWYAWTPMQQRLLAEIVEGFQQAEARRVRLRALIAEEVVAHPEMLQLVRLLGIRHLIAFALTAFVGPIERFANPKKLVAYIGLNPRVNRSGIGGGTGSLAHNGRSDLRALLIQASQSILRHGKGPTHRWAVALKMRKGIQIAVTALARKLVVSVWYLLCGRFTPLAEITDQLRVKIHKIAMEIGARRIRSLGFKNTPAFEREKLQILMGTA